MGRIFCFLFYLSAPYFPVRKDHNPYKKNDVQPSYKPACHNRNLLCSFCNIGNIVHPIDVSYISKKVPFYYFMNESGSLCGNNACLPIRTQKILDKVERICYANLACGCSSMVEHQLPKLDTRVRFPSPAPKQKAFCSGVLFYFRYLISSVAPTITSSLTSSLP